MQNFISVIKPEALKAVLSALKKEYIYGLVILLLILLYYPILNTYAITDAYEFFWSAKRNLNFIHVFIQGGRPLSGIAFAYLFQWADYISDLKYIRIIGFAGNILFLLYFYNYLTRQNFPNVLVPVALVFFLTVSPFITISMGWTALFQGGWAMLAALLSAKFILNAEDQFYDRKKLANYFTGIIFGLISLMLYQPSMTLFIIIIFLSYTKDHNLRKYIKTAGVYLVIFTLYFILFKLSLWLTDLPPLDRSGINFDIFYKLKWFFGTVLWKSASLNLILMRSSYQNLFRIFLILLFLGGIIKYIIYNGFSDHILTYFFVVIATYIFAYLPNIASMDNYISNRSLGTVVLLNAYFFYKGLAFLIPSRRGFQLATVFFILLFCVFGFINIRWGITKIHSTEYAILYKATADIFKNNSNGPVKQISIIQPSPNFLQEYKFIKRSGDEFGLLSNSQEWTTKPMFLGIVEELFEKKDYNIDSVKLSICKQEQINQCETKVPVINIGTEYLKNYKDYY